MDFEQFKARVEAEGCQARDCGEGHWQVTGPAVKPVNFYPYANHGPTLYVSGSTKGIRGPRATIENAIHFARTGALLGVKDCRPIHGTRRTMGRAERRARRKEMHNRDPHCFWCHKLLVWPEPTIDHKMPVSQGGSDYADNLCIACIGCNRDRANMALPPRGLETAPFESVPEPATEGTVLDALEAEDAAIEHIDDEEWWEGVRKIIDDEDGQEPIVSRCEEILL
jgi:hypothetical protein